VRGARRIGVMLTGRLAPLSESLISSYFGIVKKNVQDSVPKSIMCERTLRPSRGSLTARAASRLLLVNHTKADIQSELVRTLYVPDQFGVRQRRAGAVAQARARSRGPARAPQELLSEADDISQKRRACQEVWLHAAYVRRPAELLCACVYVRACAAQLLQILRRALDVVNEVRDYNVFA
jgi:hypothetical protein